MQQEPTIFEYDDYDLDETDPIKKEAKKEVVVVKRLPKTHSMNTTQFKSHINSTKT